MQMPPTAMPRIIVIPQALTRMCALLAASYLSPYGQSSRKYAKRYTRTHLQVNVRTLSKQHRQIHTKRPNFQCKFAWNFVLTGSSGQQYVVVVFVLPFPDIFQHVYLSELRLAVHMWAFKGSTWKTTLVIAA